MQTAVELETKVKSVEVATGVALEYVAQGQSTGTPVILLHGVTDSWRSYRGVLGELPGDVRAYAISQRGHGGSSRPADGYLYEDFARDVRAFMDEVGIARAVVAGHSMGSMVAQRFAADYPERTAGVVVMGGWANLRGNAPVEEFVASAIAKLEDPIDPAFVRDFQLSTLARPVAADVIDDAVSESLRVPARVWRAAFSGFLTNDCSGVSERIAAPTLVMWGERDAYAERSDQDALMAAIRGARLIVYKGAGHAFHWEDPTTFVADLVAFVNELRRANGEV